MVHNLVSYLDILMLADLPFNGEYSYIQLTWIWSNKKWRNKPVLWKCEENQYFSIASYQVSLSCYSGYLTFP